MNNTLITVIFLFLFIYAGYTIMKMTIEDNIRRKELEYGFYL